MYKTSFRALFVTSCLAFGAFFLVMLVYHWWLWCTGDPDPLYLVTSDDIVVKAGDKDVQLPKGLVLYPVNEHDEKDECYHGGHYKIYISIERDVSKLKSVGWPKEGTNYIYKLRR